MHKPVFMPIRINIIQFISTLLLATFSTTISAESSLNNHERTIGLHEAVSKTVEFNPELRAFNYQLKAQDGRVLQAGLAPSPELSFLLEDALGSGDYRGLDSAQATISIGWVWERGLRQRYIDTARASRSLLSIEANIRQLDAAAETARRYLVVLANQARLLNADKAVRLAQETIKAVHRRVEAGKTPEAERVRAQAEWARRKLEREDIEHAMGSAIHRLAAQWGDTRPGFTRVEGDILILSAIESFDVLRQRLEQNPEFDRLLSDQRLKKAELQLAQAQSRPGWRVTTGIRRLERTRDQTFVAGISIPFGERTRNLGRIAEARANLAQTGAKEKAVQIRMQTLLYVLYQKLQHSLHRADTFRDDIIPRLEKALMETRRAYNLGRYRYLEWHSAQADLLEARNALVEASIDAHRNTIEIERLTGVRIVQPATTPQGLQP